MTRAEIRDVVLRVLGNIAPEADLGAIDATTDLREQLDIDSVDFANFVIGLHTELGIDVPEVDYAKLASLDTCVAYLAAKLGA